MIRALIVDDEPLAIRVLETHLEKMSGIEVTASSSNGLDALDLLREKDIDLVFLDIEMPKLTGDDLVEALSDPPEVVFATAHRDYAVKGFELDAVDYLVKPIGLPRLVQALEKYRRRVGETTGQSKTSQLNQEPTLNVRVDRQTVRISIPEIRYVESLSDYVKIETGGDTHVPKMTISALEEKLTPHGFVRIHRSFLVNLSYVDAFTAKTLDIGGRSFSVSRTYRERIMKRLNQRGGA